jgi:glycosyltransferase involved in cell wall biosynthesis
MLEHADVLDRTLLTVIVPVYNEEENLPELAARLADLGQSTEFAGHEFLLVSDGSTDRSEAMIRDLVRRDHRFRGIFLTRNFGHQAAISTGLSHARGSVVAIIDGDLQDPPEAIILLIAALEKGADVAYGVRQKRKENVLKKFAYFAFYRLLRSISAIDIPIDAGDFSCMRRRVVEAMLELPECNRFVRGIRSWVGYTQVGVEYERAARLAGVPKYTLRKLVALAYDGLFSFTSLPIRLIQFFGFVLSITSILIALAYVFWYLISPERFPTGFASLIVSIWFFAGVQLLCLGFVGEYVIRNYEESRARPFAMVREIVSRPASDQHAGAGTHQETVNTTA